MKHKLFFIIPSLACIALCGTYSISKLTNFNKTEGVTSMSISEDKVCYQLDERVTDSINTFAAWIKLPTTLKDSEVGGIILGNHLYSTSYKGSCNFAVADHGHLKLFWDVTSYVHTFENYDLRTGEWVHIALVRDDENKTLTYYVNGVVNETISDVTLADCHCSTYYRVGMDQASWYIDLFERLESPFRGEIKQLSLFKNALSETEINDIKNNTELTVESYPQIITNLNFSNWGEEERVYDTAGITNAHMVSFNKAVPVKEVNDYDYSFVVVPDMQAMNNNKPANWMKQSEWIVDNAKSLNIKFAMYMGDMVEDKYTVNPTKCEEQWINASEFMSMLDGYVPYTFVLGNHDYDNWAQQSRASTMFNKYFPYEKYSKFNYFGGAYEEGVMDNTYSIIKINDDIEYLIFSLEEGPRDRILKWVDRVIDKHPRSRVMITTHAYLNADGIKHSPNVDGGVPSKTITYDNVNDADKMWEKSFSKHPNIMSVFCGHVCSDDIMYLKDIGDNKNSVHSFLVDLQGSILTCAMNTVLLVKVNETNKTWDLCYYWIDENACFNYQNQFQISFADEFNPTIGK